MKALIVNPNTLEAKIMGDHLTQEGFQVIAVARGVEAWRILGQQSDIRVIVIDEHVNDLPYRELIAKILNDEALRATPIVLLEDSKDLKEFNQDRPEGIYFALTKPVERVLLSSVINSALNTRDNGESSLGSW